MGACSSKGGENAKGSTAQVLDNQTTLSDIRKAIKEKMEVHSQTSTQKSVSSQNVTIIQETDPEIMNSPMFQTQTFKYWPWGGVKEGPCPNYGCIYDIEQVNEINVSSFKEDLVNDSQEIWNNIKMKLKKNAKLQMTGNNEGLEILNSAIEKSESEVNDKITDIFQYHNQAYKMFTKPNTLNKKPSKPFSSDEIGKKVEEEFGRDSFCIFFGFAWDYMFCIGWVEFTGLGK